MVKEYSLSLKFVFMIQHLALNDVEALIKHLFVSQSFLYKDCPVLKVTDMTKDGSCQLNYSVCEWSFDGINSFFPYVCVVSETKDHYNIKLPGRNALVKLKKKILKDEYLGLLDHLK